MTHLRNVGLHELERDGPGGEAMSATVGTAPTSAVPNRLAEAIRLLGMISVDCEADTHRREGQPFNGTTVSVALGEICAQIQAVAHCAQVIAQYVLGVEKLAMDGLSAQVDINAQLVAAIAKLAPREMLTGPFDSEDAAVAFVENLAAHDPTKPHKLIVNVCDEGCNLIGEW